VGVDHGQVLNVDERVRLMRDGVINYSAILISGLVGIFLTPIMLRGLGTESYGIWIAALAVGSMLGVLDFGLGWSLTREVAAVSEETVGETARFVMAVGHAYAVIGIVGTVLIATIGILMSESLTLSPESQRVALIVFFLAGLAFLTDQILAFATRVLLGLRRFGAANLLSIATVLARAAGIVGLLGVGVELVAIAVWQVVAAAATGLVALIVVARLEPRFRFQTGHFDWCLVRAHLPFGLRSQLMTAASSAVWEATPVLIGALRGSASIVPYHIGQRFPVAAAGIISSAAEVLFPAASEHERARDAASTRELLEVGTRSLVVLALPLCVVLWVLAPNLLVTWVGEAQPDTVLVLRLTTAAVFAEATGAGAFQVLWSRGVTPIVLVVLGVDVVLSLGLSLGLLLQLGIAGAALGLFLPIPLASLAVIHLASRTCGGLVLDLVREISRGLLLPTLGCAAAVSGMTFLLNPERWPDVISSALVGGAVYAVSLYLVGAREEERRFTRELLGLPAAIVPSFYRGLRRTLRHARSRKWRK
jgi:O-antigen/teichoic acid export membrane protein